MHLYSQWSQQHPPSSQLHSLFLVKYTINPPLLSPASPPTPQWRTTGYSFLPLHSAFDSVQAVLEMPCSILSLGWFLHRSNGIRVSCNEKQHSVLREGEKVSGPIVSHVNSLAHSRARCGWILQSTLCRIASLCSLLCSWNICCTLIFKIFYWEEIEKKKIHRQDDTEQFAGHKRVMAEIDWRFD